MASVQVASQSASFYVYLTLAIKNALTQAPVTVLKCSFYRVTLKTRASS